MAKWRKKVLDQHYRRHPETKDRDCWMDLLGKKFPVSVSEYEAASYKTVAARWLEYECITFWPTPYERSAYFVDDLEVLVITTLNRDWILTCYHDHHSHKCKGRQTGVPIGERRHDYKKYLTWDQEGQKIKDLKILHDATA